MLCYKSEILQDYKKMSRGETNVKQIKTTVILHKFYNLKRNFIKKVLKSLKIIK